MDKTFLFSSHHIENLFVLRANKTSTYFSINVHLAGSQQAYGCNQFGTAVHILERFEEGDF